MKCFGLVLNHDIDITAVCVCVCVCVCMQKYSLQHSL